MGLLVDRRTEVVLPSALSCISMHTEERQVDKTSGRIFELRRGVREHVSLSATTAPRGSVGSGRGLFGKVAGRGHLGQVAGLERNSGWCVRTAASIC